jgi:hypothetical protein
MVRNLSWVSAIHGSDLVCITGRELVVLQGTDCRHKSWQIPAPVVDNTLKYTLADIGYCIARISTRQQENRSCLK